MGDDEGGLVCWLPCVVHFHKHVYGVVLPQSQYVVCVAWSSFQHQPSIHIQVTHTEVIVTTVLGKGSFKVPATYSLQYRIP